MATPTITTTTTTGNWPPSIRTELGSRGFVIVRKVLSPEELSSLRAAATRTTARARSGGWPYIRTVPKQFPPWPSRPGPRGIWGVQALLHPSLPEAGTFARSYFGDAILDVVKELLDCEDEQLVMELYNLLVTPGDDGDGGGGKFALAWHRDDIPHTATPEEETRRLAELGRPGGRAWHAQWNLALCHGDDALVVVPGSHVRDRTAEERALADGAAGVPAVGEAAEMPGQVRVRLDAGDVVFYDNNILHRGIYSAGRERMCLHGSVGHVDGSSKRARNVLQHGVGEWVRSCDFSVLGQGKQRDRAERMRERLVRLGQQSGDVGYSLQG